MKKPSRPRIELNIHLRLIVAEEPDDERPSLSVRTYDTDGSEVTQVTRPIAKCEATDLGRKVGS